MKLKQAVLQAITRDEAKAVVVALDIDDVDRRSLEEMRTRLSRMRRANVEILLDHLAETRVKAVCEAVGVSSKGRKRTLVSRLLDANSRSTSALPRSGLAAAEVTQALPEPPPATPTRLPPPPAGVVRVTKPELVWPGKYNDDGNMQETPRIALPFQVIETVNESRATRDASGSGTQPLLFDTYQGTEGDTFEEGWKNKLIWGDNRLVMESLLEKFAGKIDLIYIDPPFATGADFTFKAAIGEDQQVSKTQSVLEEVAYRDTWGNGIVSYLGMLQPRLSLMRDLLSNHGSILVHVDYRTAPLVSLLLSETFGSSNLVNEVIWCYKRWTATSKSLQKLHDTIYWFSKSSEYHFNELRIPYADDEAHFTHVDAHGEFRWQYLGGRKYKLYKQDGVRAGDWWDLPYLNAMANERTGYDTQKPEVLVSRIVELASTNSSIVADFFCGSGTTLAVAEKLGRRWIGCDLGRWGIHVTRKRLLDIEECRPFEILNLGRYERQHWQGVTFSAGRNAPVTERALYEYLSFILKLYGAHPVPGMAHIHGRKGKALVHIGAVDAPVTIDEIQQALDDCANAQQNELHVLGWEWEMGLSGGNNLRRGGLMQRAAEARGVKLRLLYIPREVMEQQAADKGDVRFFELAYMDAKAEKVEGKRRTFRLALQDFVIPSPELIPDEVRERITAWSDYIDYWAVDWDFRNDTFIQGWVTYRTRKDRSLLTESASHTYDEPGTYRILVKVVDVFGNDTSQALDLTVR